MTEDLKPCPFCGGEAEINEYNDGSGFVSCPNCECRTDLFDKAVSSVTVWNERAETRRKVSAESVARALFDHREQLRKEMHEINPRVAYHPGDFEAMNLTIWMKP